jgi:hypothetical protein
MSEPENQARLLNEFKQNTTDELAAIHSRLTWMLMPAFFILLAVLGLSVFTWIKVSEVQLQIKSADLSIAELRKTLHKQVADSQPRPTVLSNGFTKEDREEFYHLAEGSEVFPLDWFKALKNKDTKNLLVDDLPGMGFLRDWDADNKDGMPVGLTSVPARGLEPLGKMVGLNCAACHVGEMSYQGKSIRIDGAPNFLDTRTFFKSLIESAGATLQDPDELVAFVARLKDEGAVEQAADAKSRSGARKILDSVLDRAEDELKDAVASAAKKIIANEKASKPLDVFATVKEAGQDAKQFRALLLKGFDKKEFLQPLLVNPLVKKKLEALVEKADHEGPLLHGLEKIYITVRLLKARLVFLGKLGKVGADPRTAWGPGRVDAFGSARAFLFEPEDSTFVPKNPVSYPFLWGLHRTGWFHYDNNTTSILQRNFGQALGVGAVYDPKTNSSTLNPRNLYRLEELATKLKPPAWPKEILGAIDQESAKRGMVHFDNLCSNCHGKGSDTGIFNQKNKMFDVKALGTDPGRAQVFAEKLDGTPFATLIGDKMQVVMDQSFKDNNLTPEEKEKFARAPWEGSAVVKVQWEGLGKYSARPLNGIWATGPFLHNGSVPTLDDLLQPASKRPEKFVVGNREFDPIKLGYVSDRKDQEPNFNTQIDGNHNTGHEYGTKLEEKDRKDLLEYLKSM